MGIFLLFATAIHKILLLIMSQKIQTKILKRIIHQTSTFDVAFAIKQMVIFSKLNWQMNY
jgi:hypothetical protein